MPGTYRQFFDALGERESSDNYAAVNSLGYLGRYQFGELALIDVGYYTLDGTSVNDWKAGFWTGKGGIDSKAEFLAGHAAQDAAIRAYMVKQWGYLAGVHEYEGQVLAGVKITVSGMLGGAHLVGWGGAATYLNSGGDTVPRDGNNVPITGYITLFAGYATPFVADHTGAETIVGGSHNDGLKGFGGADTLRGRGGADRLDGGAAVDTLFGQGGNDTFLFRNTGAADIVRDFATGDHLAIYTVAFGGTPGQFEVFNTAGHTAPNGKATVFYNHTNGALSFDPDGNGATAFIVVATLANKPALLHHADLLLI